MKTEFIRSQIKAVIQSRWARAENIAINAEQGTATFLFDGCVARWSTKSPATVSIAGSDHGAWLRWTKAQPCLKTAGFAVKTITLEPND